MRTGRPKQALVLTEEERGRLRSMAHRARSQPLLARRARVVLACGDGLDNQTVARKLKASLGMVGKWRARFLKDRLEGLYDEPRPGAPRKIGDDQVERVIIQTLESTPRGQTHCDAVLPHRLRPACRRSAWRVPRSGKRRRWRQLVRRAGLRVWSTQPLSRARES